MIDWMLIGKALLGPFTSTVTKPLGKSAKRIVFGLDHEVAITKLCNQSLDAALDLVLDDQTPEEMRHHIKSVLELILNKAAVDGVLTERAHPDSINRVLMEIENEDSPVDTATLDIDMRRAVAAFITEFSTRVKSEAKQHGSPVFEYVTEEKLEAIELHLSSLCQAWLYAAPPSPETMSKVGARMVSHEIAKRLNEEPGRDVFIDSYAQIACKEFTDSNWRTDCKERAEILLRFYRTELPMDNVARALGAIDWSATYEAIRSSLRELKLRDVNEQLATLATRAPRTDSDSRRESIVEARKCAQWLLNQAENPRFRSCLPISGMWGSGKTRLLVEFANERLKRGEYVIFLGPDFGRSVRDELLSKSGALLGWQPRDIAELSRLITKALKSRLFVLIDDLGVAAARLPELLIAIQDLISECTCTDAIRWVVTADALHLDSVLSADHPTFWIHYGYWPNEKRPAGVAGWLDLDAINIGGQVGLKLLECRSDERNRADLAVIRRDVANFNYEARSLCNPLPAWLRLEVAQEDADTGVINIHIERFVAAYWSQRKRTLAMDAAQAEEFEHLIRLLAQRLAATRNSSVMFKEFTISAINSLDLTREVVVRDINVLLSGGVLNRRVIGDIEIEVPKEELEPKLDFFWGYRIARVLLNSVTDSANSPTGIFSSFRPWGVRASTGNWLAEAVTEFGLALLWKHEKTSVATSVWESWYRDTDLSPHPLWLAGVSIPGAAQEYIRDWLMKSPSRTTGKRDVFLLLRLLALAQSSNWRSYQRFNALRPHYSLIGQSGLGPYLIYVVSTILGREDLTTSKNFSSVLSALSGSEEAGVADLVADLALRAGWRMFGGDASKLLNSVVSFLKRSADPAYAQDFPHDARPGLPASNDMLSVDPNSASAHFFWHHLIRATCRSVIDDGGVEAFWELVRADWFWESPNNTGGHVATRMRQEANVSLGSIFRSRHGVDPTTTGEFIRLIDSLANGRTPLRLPPYKQQELAFFMIRHTAITGSRPGVPVDSSLWPTLRRLCHDKRFQAHNRYAEPMCAANGCTRCQQALRSRDRGKRPSGRGDAGGRESVSRRRSRRRRHR